MTRLNYFTINEHSSNSKFINGICYMNQFWSINCTGIRLKWITTGNIRRYSWTKFVAVIILGKVEISCIFILGYCSDSWIFCKRTFRWFYPSFKRKFMWIKACINKFCCWINRNNSCRSSDTQTVRGPFHIPTFLNAQI